MALSHHENERLRAYGYDGKVETLGQAADRWKSAAEAMHAEHEGVGWVRFLIPIVAQLVATLALVLTLYFQMKQLAESRSQFAASQQLQQEQREDEDWKSVLSHAKEVQGPEGIFGLYQLVGFLDSPRHSIAARNILVSALGHTAEPDSLQVILPELVKRTTRQSLRDLVTISKNLRSGFDMEYANYQDAQERWQRARDEADAQRRRKLAAGERRIFVPPAPDSGNVDLLWECVAIASKQLIDFVRQNPGASGERTDLRRAAFASCDLRGMDLSRLDLDGGSVDTCDIREARLAGVSAKGVMWYATAWWNAKDIDAELLEDLKGRFPFSADAPYPHPQSQSDYEEHLARLEQSLASARPSQP